MVLLSTFNGNFLSQLSFEKKVTVQFIFKCCIYSQLNKMNIGLEYEDLCGPSGITMVRWLVQRWQRLGDEDYVLISAI